MKLSVTILLGLLLFACSTSLLSNNALAKNKSATLKDTLFLERSICDNFYRDSFYHFYHAVYVETNRNSEYYNQLADFSFTDSENLDEYNKGFKRKGIRLSKINTTDLPTEWVPLYQYKNKYYVYSPSEPGNLNRRILNDSLLICWYLDGPYPYALSSVKKIADTIYSITTKELFINTDVFAKPEILNIYIIDKKIK